MAIYFTSEEAAREGERREPPPELQAQMEEMAALSIGEPAFFDLRQPWFHSPRCGRPGRTANSQGTSSQGQARLANLAGDRPRRSRSSP
jgi:hypothetical protein